MIRRSVVTGALLGAILVLIAIYPVLVTQLGPSALPGLRSGSLRT